MEQSRKTETKNTLWASLDFVILSPPSANPSKCRTSDTVSYLLSRGYSCAQALSYAASFLVYVMGHRMKRSVLHQTWKYSSYACKHKYTSNLFTNHRFRWKCRCFPLHSLLHSFTAMTGEMKMPFPFSIPIQKSQLLRQQFWNRLTILAVFCVGLSAIKQTTSPCNGAGYIMTKVNS